MLLDDCGRNAETKHLPADVKNWNKQAVSKLLEGYFDADGSFNKGNNVQRFVSISYDLILGISELVRMVYRRNVNITIRKPQELGIIEDRVIHQNISYEGRFKLDLPKRSYYEYDEENNIMWVNLLTPSGVVPNELMVYNLTVENSNTYLAEDIMVHNCSAYNWESQGSYNKRATYICPMHKARALINVYYWNKFYRIKGENKRMKNYCPKEWALQIISEEEYEMLNKLAEE